MTFFEEAEALAGLISMKKLTQSELAVLMGTSQSYIANKLRLLKLSPAVRDAIISHGLSERHARAMLRLKNEEIMLDLIDKIHEMKLPVAESEALIEAYVLEEMPKKLNTGGVHTSIDRFERILRESLRSLRSLGVNVDLRTSAFGNTKYITIAVECD